jgi:hypothetical protein
MTSVEPKIYVLGSFGGTHQNLCPAISGILRAQLHVLLERVNYYTASMEGEESVNFDLSICK